MGFQRDGMMLSCQIPVPAPHVSWSRSHEWVVDWSDECEGHRGELVCWTGRLRVGNVVVVVIVFVHR
jgi:hypothetical protein